MIVIKFLSYIYFLTIKLRETLWRYDIKYRYLPESYSKIFLLLHMDLFWIKRGFLGYNKCLIPKLENGFSKRFNDKSIWFQSWIGTYHLTSFLNFKGLAELEKVILLSNSALLDQNYWLLSYGVRKPLTQLNIKSLKKVSQESIKGFNQVIYYGEMATQIDDSKYNKFDIKLIHYFSSIVACIYNKVKINPNLLNKDRVNSSKRNINLFGYFSVIELPGNKYLLTYVCGDLEKRDKLNNELLKVISNLDIRN